MSYRMIVAVAAALSAAGLAQAQQTTLPVGHGFPGGKPLDIAGIFFGMDGEKARPVLNRHYANQKGKPHFAMAKMPVSNEMFLRQSQGTYYAGDVNYDNMYVLFSGPASGNQVVYITREAQFLKDTRPSRAATLAAIKEKYGEPSNPDGNAMDFYFSKGKRLTDKEDADFRSCRDGGYGINHAGQRAIGEDVRISHLRQAYQAMQNAKGQCDIYIRISLRDSYDTIGGRIVKNESVIGGISAWAFDYARFFATTNADAKAIEDLTNKARQSIPSGRAAPKL
jgi:hypothetical protein